MAVDLSPSKGFMAKAMMKKGKKGRFANAHKKSSGKMNSGLAAFLANRGKSKSSKSSKDDNEDEMGMD